MNHEIEHYLLEKHGAWIPADCLADTMGVSARSLRHGGENDISGFTISGDHGYLHVKLASDEEFNRFTNRIRSHAMAEMDRVRALERNRLKDGQTEMSL